MFTKHCSPLFREPTSHPVAPGLGPLTLLPHSGWLVVSYSHLTIPESHIWGGFCLYKTEFGFSLLLFCHTSV